MDYLDVLYRPENNLFQSLNWIAFQEEYGRKTVWFGDSYGIVFDLPLGKKFVWVQKGPQKMPNFKKIAKKLPQGTVFVRFEPKEKPNTQKRIKEVKRGSLLSGQSSPRASLFLDINKSEEEILAQMKPKTRYNIRLAERKGLEVKMLDNVDILYDLLQKTAQRKNSFFPHRKKYYTRMINNLAKRDVAHIFVAEKDGDFLAAILVAFFGDVAIYLHGGFDEKKKNLMAPYLCHWEAIKCAHQKGCKYYDLWGISENNDPHDPWTGITRFKAGFGGEKVFFAGSYDFIVSPFWYNLFSVAAKLRKIFKKLWLKKF